MPDASTWHSAFRDGEGPSRFERWKKSSTGQEFSTLDRRHLLELKKKGLDVRIAA
jgi:hypothetical protein